MTTPYDPAGQQPSWSGPEPQHVNIQVEPVAADATAGDGDDAGDGGEQEG